MRKDHATNMDIRPVIVPAANSNLGTTPLVGSVIDSKGYDALTYGIVTGVLSDADATYTALLEDSDESNANFTAVADADLVGTEAAAGFTFANDGVTRKLGYVGGKRYTRLTITPASADSGNSPIAAVAILGSPAMAPVA